MRLENVFFFFRGQQNATLETSPKIIEPLSLSQRALTIERLIAVNKRVHTSGP